MNRLNSLGNERRRDKSPTTADQIREKLLGYTKDFKTSWVNLGRALYPVWKDKFFYTWGYDKFEYYTERELGIKKATAIKLLKSYFFLEKEEPAYLAQDFADDRQPTQVPSCEAVNVLRLAKQSKELTEEDYHELKKAVFEEGKEATTVRKDLTSMMKERKEVDPEEERDKRNELAIRRFMNAIRSFQKDMETLKVAPVSLMEGANELLKKLEKEIK